MRTGIMTDFQNADKLHNSHTLHGCTAIGIYTLYVLCSISNYTSPHQHMGGTHEKAKAVKSQVHPVHPYRIIQPKRNDNLGNAAQDDVLYLQNAELPTDPDSIAAPYDIRLLEHRQIGNMALKSRPLLSYGVRSCPATGISRKPRYTPRRPVRAALYRL